MKEIKAGVYPMYLTEKNVVIKNERVVSLTITCYSTCDINVGDIYCHKNDRDKFSVVSVEDMQPAKGNHKQPTKWYKLKLGK